MPIRDCTTAFARLRLLAGGRRTLLRATSLCLVVAATACYDQVTSVDESDGRTTIVNDEDQLAERMRYTDEDVPIDAPAPGVFGTASLLAADGPQRAPTSLTLTLVAELASPELGGETIQATSVSRRSRDAVLVSYNVRGETFMGGIDYLINWFGRFPSVLSSVGFTDSDVSSVSFDGRDIYLAGATDDPAFNTSASLETLRLGWFGISLAGNARVDLSSFAATSVLAVDDYVYVTTGDDGHLYALNDSDLTVAGQFALDDARWVEYDEDSDRIVVVQGTPGRLSLFEPGTFPGGSMNQTATYAFPGATVPESKSAMDIAGGKAFVAAGPDGVQIVCLATGSVLGSVPRPDPASVGLPPEVVVTNAVTVEGDLMFISNGEAGVYVATVDQPFEDTGCSAQAPTVIGRLRFDDLQSVNHVDYESGFLFVAAGLGGVKIVLVTVVP